MSGISPTSGRPYPPWPFVSFKHHLEDNFQESRGRKRELPDTLCAVCCFRNECFSHDRVTICIGNNGGDLLSAGAMTWLPSGTGTEILKESRHTRYVEQWLVPQVLNTREFINILASSPWFSSSLRSCDTWPWRVWMKLTGPRGYQREPTRPQCIDYRSKLLSRQVIAISLVVQWLRLHPSNAGVLGSILGQGTRFRMPQLRLITAK